MILNVHLYQKRKIYFDNKKNEENHINLIKICNYRY